MRPQNSISGTTLLLFVSIAAFLGGSCSGRQTDLEKRLTAALKAENESSWLRLQGDRADLNRQTESQIKFGNHFHEDLQFKLERVQMEWVASIATLDRLASHSSDGISMADSIQRVLIHWAKEKRKFWMQDSGQIELPDWDDSTDCRMVAEAPLRFTRSNAIDWEAEIELVRAQILADAFQELAYLESKRGCIGNFTLDFPDTLTFVDAPEENSIVAGEEAKIALRVSQNVLHRHHAVYTGSGRIENNKDCESATMYLQTSEDMIPIGQNEAFIPYNAEAAIPKADGDVARISLQGKIKIRRPCQFPTFSPTQKHP